MTRREFIRVLAAATVAGFVLDRRAAGADALLRPAESSAERQPAAFHRTVMAQLRPVQFPRAECEPAGVGVAANRPPHLVGERLLRYVASRRARARLTR